MSALLCAGPALAQAGAGRCYQLRAELDRLGRPVSVDETRIAQYQGAIDRQSDELQRTTEYAQSLGCDIEGGGQCVGLQGNIRRMQRNLAVLQSQYSRISANAGDQREDLQLPRGERVRERDRGRRIGVLAVDVGLDQAPGGSGVKQRVPRGRRSGPRRSGPAVPPP